VDDCIGQWSLIPLILLTGSNASGQICLSVADYGNSHVDDHHALELDLRDDWQRDAVTCPWMLKPSCQTLRGTFSAETLSFKKRVTTSLTQQGEEAAGMTEHREYLSDSTRDAISLIFYPEETSPAPEWLYGKISCCYTFEATI
jgi:hypothetical protein